MKVVLLCGGLGVRLREYSENTPKPMIPIGNRPIVWNLMKYYAHYGNNDFILCLGHNASVIKVINSESYKINYTEGSLSSGEKYLSLKEHEYFMTYLITFE